MSDLVDLIVPLEQDGSKAVVRAWLKAVGEHVAENEPVVELETDKVAVEVASPTAGVLAEQRLTIDADAPPGAVIGRIRPQLAGISAAAPAADAPRIADIAPPAVAGEQRLSPSVRRLIRESGLDPRNILGTGRDGRLTRADVAMEIEHRTAILPGSRIEGPRRVPHDRMRRRIAEHMSRSVATAPHVTAVFEADFSAIIAHRALYKAKAAERGLTFTAYFVAAAAAAMAAAPEVNSRWHEDHLEIFEAVNIGVGVALGDKGLIAPVIHDTHRLDLESIAARLADLTERARLGRLTPADVQGGTFSISNHGVSGSLVATPIIINQPQSAILGVGKLEKRVVVRQVGGVDAIQIRPMAYVSLTIDHRVIDGAQTNAWLARFIEILESWPIGAAISDR